MRILHLSDLHLNSAWLDWARLQAPEFNLVCVSGDLLDMFSREGPLQGMVKVKRWVQTFPGKLALCSGNHDANCAEAVPDPCLLPKVPKGDRAEAEKLMMLERWMDALGRPGIVVTDGCSEILETDGGRIVITTIPYDFTAVTWRRDLWRLGAQQRRETGAPWIVLHHDPPSDSRVGGEFGNSGLSSLVNTYRPDFLLSGHMHLQPYRGDFLDRLGRTWCFNPGAAQETGVPFTHEPNHIILDLAEHTATWRFRVLGSCEMRSRTRLTQVGL